MVGFLAPNLPELNELNVVTSGDVSKNMHVGVFFCLCAWAFQYLQQCKQEMKFHCRHFSFSAQFLVLPDCSSCPHLASNGLPLAPQMLPPLLALSQNRSKLKLYIAHLTDLCHDRDPSILSQLTPPSHYHHSDPEDWEEELQKMSVEQVVKTSQAVGHLGKLCLKNDTFYQECLFQWKLD